LLINHGVNLSSQPRGMDRIVLQVFLLALLAGKTQGLTLDIAEDSVTASVTEAAANEAANKQATILTGIAIDFARAADVAAAEAKVPLHDCYTSCECTDEACDCPMKSCDPDLDAIATAAGQAAAHAEGSAVAAQNATSLLGQFYGVTDQTSWGGWAKQACEDADNAAGRALLAAGSATVSADTATAIDVLIAAAAAANVAARAAAAEDSNAAAGALRMAERHNETAAFAQQHATATLVNFQCNWLNSSYSGWGGPECLWMRKAYTMLSNVTKRVQASADAAAAAAANITQPAPTPAPQNGSNSSGWS